MPIDEEAIRASIREAKRRRLLERSAQASRAGAVQRDPEFVAKIDAKLAALSEAMAAVPEGEGKKARRAAKAAQARVGALEQELAKLRQDEQDQIRLYGDAADRIIAMKARGEDVDAFEAETADFARDEHGAVVRHKTGPNRRLPVLVYDWGLRAKKLTGPEEAAATGYLAGGPLAVETLLRVAEEYREAYLYGEGQVSGKGEGGAGFGPKAPQPKRAEQSETLADMRRLLTTRLRTVVDLVCGQDMRICDVRRAIGDGDDRTTARALRVGLDAARRGRIEAVQDRKARGTSGDVTTRITVGNALIAMAGARC